MIICRNFKLSTQKVGAIGNDFSFVLIWPKIDMDSMKAMPLSLANCETSQRMNSNILLNCLIGVLFPRVTRWISNGILILRNRSKPDSKTAAAFGKSIAGGICAVLTATEVGQDLRSKPSRYKAEYPFRLSIYQFPLQFICRSKNMLVIF